MENPRPGPNHSNQRRGMASPAAPSYPSPRRLPDGLLGRAVYSTFFTISYGVAFPTLLAASFVPRHNAVVNGLVDGAQDARDQLQGMAASRAQERAQRLDEQIAQGKEDALIEESAYALAAIL